MQFSADSPGFVTNPTLKEKIHVVVFVMDATTVDILQPAMIDKIRNLQAKINQKGKSIFSVIVVCSFLMTKTSCFRIWKKMCYKTISKKCNNIFCFDPCIKEKLIV